MSNPNAPKQTDYRIVLCEGRTLGIGPKRWWWRLESVVNGQVLATSEVYSSAAKRDLTANRIASAFDLQVEQ